MLKPLPLLALAALAFATAMPADAGVLVTPGYAVVVAEQCAEGDVACADVVYTGVSRRTGASITLHGAAFSTTCADGTTPCRHLGWRFPHGTLVYTVTDDGALLVTRDGKLVLSQQGKWVR
ncbi:hypothetical protein [Frateuria sp. STR12]|uniref:hypothetical protein n=1 Tax=Frateuria hangzhouensis TaxID=2995589 RepID=UPI002260AC6E|nr:hypothetical protein [Frateuria sp. STR12]MCX7513818.1 hypothetical protein [Frateuria sp. STR12]